MPIFGSDGGLVGTVDRVIGVRIRLARLGVSEADQFFIPLSWVANVTDRVTLDRPAADARPASATLGVEETKRSLVGPIAWTGIGVVGVGLLYGASTLIPHGRQKAPVGAAASPTPVAVAAAPAAPQPVRSATKPLATSGPLAADQRSITGFLNSPAPAPQSFSLDTVGFAPNSAAVSGPGEKVVAGIAAVMTTHLNTKIKIAVAPGGGALAARRAAAIRAALVGRGVAAYRIATGTTRARTRGPALTMIILAK